MKCLMCEGQLTESTKMPGWYTCTSCGIEYSRIVMKTVEGGRVKDEKPLMCSTAFIDHMAKERNKK